MRNAEKAVSLMEVIVVVIIIGIAAGIFLTAGFGKNFEKQRSLEGVHGLQLIYNAEKRRLLDKGQYYSCTDCTSRELTAELGILVSQNYFNYSISTSSTQDGTGFKAAAVRTSGVCKGKQMSVDQTTSDVVKECDEWK